MLELRVFGSLDLVREDGTPVRSVLSQPKRTALLIYLALARPAGFRRRDTLLALFWPERDQDHARNALNQSVYRLRRSLGAEVIRTRGREEIGIAEGSLWCDALVFREALRADDPVRALELYRGELLEGFHVSGASAFERWLDRERSHLRDHSRRAAVELAEAARDPVEARRWLERALEIAPGDEAVVRRLMEVLERAGDRAAALRAFELLVTHLERTLGVEPSPETRALAEKFRGRQRIPAEAIPAASAAPIPGSAETGAAMPPLRDRRTSSSNDPMPYPDRPPVKSPRSDRRQGARRVLLAAATGGALLVGTGWWLFAGTGDPDPTIERLAVLPLANLMNDPEQEYFVQGIHDRLISELQEAGVTVIARTSVLPYGKAEKRIREIAGELGVDAVIEGSVFRAGDSVAIEVRLADGVTEEYVWRESFDGDLRNVGTLHRDLTRAIAGEIKLALDPETKARLAEPREVDPRAYEAYLKGTFHARRLTRVDLDTALEYFQTALEIDSTYAPALVGIARVWGHRTRVEFLSPFEVRQKREPVLERALTLDSTLAEAHMVLAATKTWGHWDFEGGEASFRRAIDLNPGLAEARLLLAQLLMILGRWEEGAEQARIGRALDPLNPFVQLSFAQTLAFQRRYREAIGVLEVLFRRNPGVGGGRMVLSGLYHLVERYEEALRLVRDDYEARGESDVVAALDQGYREAGYRRALRLAADTLAARAPGDYVAANAIAQLYARSGAADEAVDWLEAGFEDGGAGPLFIGVVPIWEGLHDHPRFQVLAHRVKVPILTGPSGAPP